MATPNPLERTYPDPPAPVSKHCYLISGLWTTVYGLDEAKDNTEVSCLWLFHPRLQTQGSMQQIAYSVVEDWLRQPSSPTAGLIAVSFDQRNHGTREMNNLANKAWRDGNENHAQDMFSIYRCNPDHGEEFLSNVIQMVPP